MMCPTHRLGPFSSSLPSVVVIMLVVLVLVIIGHQSSVQLGCGRCICCAGSHRCCLLQGIVIDVMVTW